MNRPRTLPALVTDARSKLETLAWFARRPAMYAELGRRILHRRVRTTASIEAERSAKAEATAWCRATVVRIPEFLERIGVPADVQPFSVTHGALWSEAIRAFEACSGTMGGPAHVDLLYHLVHNRAPTRFVETGVAAGWSSLVILTAMDELGRGELTSVDMPYPKRGNEALVGCVVPARLRSRWTLIRLPDRDALPRAVRSGVSMAHYDSDKSYAGRMFAYRLLWNAIEPGGLLLSDDVEDNLAFRDFATRVGGEPWVLEKAAGNFAGCLVRPR